MKHLKLLSLLIAMLLSIPIITSCSEDEEEPLLNPNNNSYNDPEYVDLGLSVKWATCNVGATVPEEYGNYFAWGEIEPQSYYYYWDFWYHKETGKIILDSDGRPMFSRKALSVYTLTDALMSGETVVWDGVEVAAVTLPDGQKVPARAYYEATLNYYEGKGRNFYKYYNGKYDSITKYCTDSDYGTVDNKTVLELSDDVAHVNWGGNWRMPTEREIEELRDVNNCTWTWTTQNGVKGYKVTSKKNGNNIFLPAAGYRDDSCPSDMESFGCYWSSSLYNGDRFITNFGAFSLFFNSSCVLSTSRSRFGGWTVRAVCE